MGSECCSRINEYVVVHNNDDDDDEREEEREEIEYNREAFIMEMEITDDEEDPEIEEEKKDPDDEVEEATPEQIEGTVTIPNCRIKLCDEINLC